MGCTSSQYGMPPPNIKEFAHQLLLAAESNPGCLSHLQHAVYGNGDETYWKTYMNMPRYLDKLLEKCGSRRFFARGETGEPNAALDTGKCEIGENHHDITEFDIKKLEAKLGELKGQPSIFSKL